MCIRDRLYIITGANGHLGNTIIRLLEKRDVLVRGLILPSETAKNHRNITYIKGDVRDRSTLLPLFEDCQDMEVTVIHTAGIIDISEHVSPLLYDVNVNGTKTVVSLCLEKQVKRMVYVSSVHAIPEKGKLHTPVSYTHLDVYKRQAPSEPVHHNDPPYFSNFGQSLVQFPDKY